MVYYLVGGSTYDNSDYFLGVFMDAGGNSDEWGSNDFVRGDIEDDDPFWSLGLNTGVTPITRGNKQVEFGLFDNYRIKITTSGIFGWIGPGDDDFGALGGGGATSLDGLTDVVISGTPADNEVLAWDNGTSRWINQTAAEASLATAGHGHGQLHDQNHDNTDHTTNYETANANIQSHVGTPPEDSHHAKQHAMDSATYHTRTDINTLNASTSYHGFLKKLDNVDTNFMNGQGNWTVPVGSYGDADAVTAVEAAGLVLASTKVITSADENLNFTFGRVAVGSPASDEAYFAHRDMFTTTSYALKQTSVGQTMINAANTQSIYFKVNDVTKFSVGSSVNAFAALSMNVNKIISLTAGEATGEAVEFDQLHAEVHVLATSGPHSSSLPLTDLDNYAAQGDLMFGGVSDWGVLTKGTSGKYLKAGATTISWEDVPAAPIETGSSFPGSPVDGQTYYDIEDEATYIWSDDAQAWIQIGASGVGGEVFQPPIGYITMFSGSWTDNSTIPGWYKCDGNNGTIDLVDKFVRGGATSGAEGGSDDAVIVSHRHRVFYTGPGASALKLDVTASTTTKSSDYLSDLQGESGTDKNLPTYYTLIFIQRVS